MENLLTALFDYKVKQHAIFAAIVFFLLDMAVYIWGNVYLNSIFNHVLIQYVVVISLLTAISSKDKNDDERSVQIRYSVLKNSFGLLVIVFGVLALIFSSMEKSEVSILVILYSLEGILVIHLLLYYLANKYNPKWLFKEDTAPKDMNKLMIVLIYSFFFLIMVSFVINYLNK